VRSFPGQVEILKIPEKRRGKGTGKKSKNSNGRNKRKIRLNKVPWGAEGFYHNQRCKLTERCRFTFRDSVFPLKGSFVGDKLTDNRIGRGVATNYKRQSYTLIKPRKEKGAGKEQGGMERKEGRKR